jgi:bifunctional enzyme CysN/CysC
MSERPLTAGTRYSIKHTTRSARAVVERLRYQIDVNTLHRNEDFDRLDLNEIGRVKLRTSVPLIFDEYRRNRATGSFILADESTNQTVGAGMIIEPHITDADARRQITWHPTKLTRPTRWELIKHRGATVWLTGLSAAGKSTIAAALEERVAREGQPAYLLDGDNLRHGLCSDLGFGPQDRAENVRRVAEVARLFADAGIVAIASLISPYAADREQARRIHAESGIEFLEVFVNTPLSECERRDPKGLYARAREGVITGFTGIDAPYEAPQRPDVELRPAEHEFGELVEMLVAALRERGILDAGGNG